MEKLRFIIRIAVLSGICLIWAAALSGCGRSSFGSIGEAAESRRDRLESRLSEEELTAGESAPSAPAEAEDTENGETYIIEDSDIAEETSSDAAETSEEAAEKEDPEKQATDLFGFPVEKTEGLTGFMHDQLSEEVQDIYASLYTGIADRQSVFTIRAGDTDGIKQALSAVLADHPEFFWLDGNASMNGFQMLGIWEITLEFNIEEDRIPEVQAEIDRCCGEYLASLPEGAGEYEKVKAAYEYLILHTDYDLQSDLNQNIQSVFLNHVSVCAGYAKAMKYLLDQAGVWCGYVEGQITDTGEGHAWDLVRIDGEYSYVDPSWGDPTYGEDDTDAMQLDIIYDYLCVTSRELSQLRHQADEQIVLPECTSTAHDYYIMNGMFYPDWDPDAVSQAVWSAVDAGETRIFFKFGSFDAYAQAMANLFPEEGGGLLEEPLQQRMEWDETSSMRYFYSCSDELWVIKVYW